MTHTLNDWNKKFNLVVSIQLWVLNVAGFVCFCFLYPDGITLRSNFSCFQVSQSNVHAELSHCYMNTTNSIESLDRMVTKSDCQNNVIVRKEWTIVMLHCPGCFLDVPLSFSI